MTTKLNEKKTEARAFVCLILVTALHLNANATIVFLCQPRSQGFSLSSSREKPWERGCFCVVR